MSWRKLKKKAATFCRHMGIKIVGKRRLVWYTDDPAIHVLRFYEITIRNVAAMDD